MIVELPTIWFLFQLLFPHICEIVTWTNALTVSSLGAYLGITGGVFNSSISNRNKIIAFSIWEISNFILAWWAYCANQPDLMYMYIFYMITSTIGLYNHAKIKFQKAKQNE